MDKALIFCRTKLDCDNLENYFISLGGGPRPRDPNHQFSCAYITSNLSTLNIDFLKTKFVFYFKVFVYIRIVIKMRDRKI